MAPSEAPTWKNQEAFAIVFSQIPLLVVASLIAYWCGEFANSYTLSKMKLFTSGKYLWTRTVGSTVVGQFVDTVLLYCIAFSATISTAVLIRGIFSAYLFKVVYEVLATPLTYAVVGFLKRSEGLDAFDYHSDYKLPFHVGIEISFDSPP